MAHMSQTTDGSKVTKSEMVQVLEKFIFETTYRPPTIPSTNKELEGKMYEYMHSRNIACPQLERTLHLAASLIEIAFPECTLVEKTTIAMFNWFIIYIDDTSPKDVKPFAVFGPRFLSQARQLDPVLDAFVDILRRICDQYEPVTANYILASAFNYVSSTCIEPEIERHAVVPGVVRFPWFMRGHTGISLAFALMLFPKSKGVSAVEYVQVLDEMNFWISGVNDLLSFPKEEFAGERNNYIHIRSRTEDKLPKEVLKVLIQELHVSRKLICASLARISGASAIWSAFENGYIKWHLIQERYMLADMILTE